jgi:bleomycin hydrolase
MKTFFILAAALLLSASLFTFAQAAPPAKPEAFYAPDPEDPILKELEARDKKLQDEAQAKTDAIVKEQEAKKEKEKDDEKALRFDMKGIRHPSSAGDFKVQAWHFPPVPQYLTGTCWAFSTVSYYESEIKRLHDKEIKLSEMWTVYWEYVEKAKGYIATRGNSVFDEGSESEAVPRVWKTYGIVPESAYAGVLDKNGLHDHAPMVEEMKAYLAYCKANNYWDEPQIISAIKGIMNKTMGEPPAEVKWEGRTYTPQAFLADVCGLKMDDYVPFISTLQAPFWTRAELKVEDNWWHDAEYLNVPLDVFYGIITRAVKAGSTLAIGGDVTEPGYNGHEKIAVVADFDIPPEMISQSAREMRIESGSTADDHGIHLVGWTQIDGQDWFLIKDSARAARKAPPEGYLFYRGDYVKLKMLSFTVHKSFVEDVLEKFAKKEKR